MYLFVLCVLQEVPDVFICTVCTPGGPCCIYMYCVYSRRSLMYVPGNDERKISKIPVLGADCICLDCEDGVALNKKVIIILFFKTNLYF